MPIGSSIKKIHPCGGGGGGDGGVIQK